MLRTRYIDREVASRPTGRQLAERGTPPPTATTPSPSTNHAVRMHATAPQRKPERRPNPVAPTSHTTYGKYQCTEKLKKTREHIRVRNPHRRRTATHHDEPDRASTPHASGNQRSQSRSGSTANGPCRQHAVRTPPHSNSGRDNMRCNPHSVFTATTPALPVNTRLDAPRAPPLQHHPNTRQPKPPAPATRHHLAHPRGTATITPPGDARDAQTTRPARPPARRPN